MTIEKLNSVRKVAAEIRELEWLKARMYQKAADLVRPMNDMPKEKNLLSPTEILALKILKLTERIDNLSELKNKLAAELSVELVNSPLPVKVRSGMLMRYVECKNFRDISLETGLSDARVYQLHREGVLKICHMGKDCHTGKN